MTTRLLTSLLWLVFAWFSLFSAAHANTLNDGDRIVFFGDSITEFGVFQNGYVTLINKAILTTYPEKHIDVIGAGVAGNTVLDLQKRVDHDVLQQWPSVVVIYVGVNDIWSGGRTIPKQQFSQNLQQLVQKIRTQGAQTVLVTPAVMGERAMGENRFDAFLEEYAEITRTVGKYTRSPVVDLRRAFVSYLQIYNLDNRHQGVLTKDSIHLNWRGNQLVAALLAEALEIPAQTSLFNGVQAEFRKGLGQFLVSQ